MDCCSNNYSEFNKAHYLHQPHYQGGSPSVNSPYYSSLYNSPHSLRYPHHHPLAHVSSIHRNEQNLLSNPVYGPNLRDQQQNFYDVGGGATNPNVYDRYNHIGYQGHGYNHSHPFSNYGYNSGSETSNYYSYHHQLSHTQQQQQSAMFSQHQQSSTYYSSQHSYESYRNSSFPYHPPVHSTHPYNYHQSQNVQRDFYPYNSEYYSSNSNTRYYPTPPPSAPLPSPFSSSSQSLSRESYSQQETNTNSLRSGTPAPIPSSYPPKESHYPTDVPEQKPKNNRDVPEDSTLSSSALSPNSNSSTKEETNNIQPKQEIINESIKTPLSSPQCKPQPMPNLTNNSETSETLPTANDDQNEQRQAISPPNAPTPPNKQSQTPSSPQNQNQIQKQTTEEATTLLENNSDSNANQNNTHQQQMTPTTETELNLSATGFPFIENNNIVRESNSSRARKSPRNKEKLLKSISSSRKMFENQLPNNDPNERCGTPFVSQPPYNQNHMFNNYPQTNQRYMPGPGHQNPPPNYWYSQPPSHHAWMMNSYQRNRRPNFMDTQVLPPMNYQRNNPYFDRSRLNGMDIESPLPKRTKRRSKPESPGKSMGNSPKEEVLNKNVTPLPGFQQAFGSTEIGKFSEAFFNAPESPNPYYNSMESDIESPQPWEYGDSLEGPHINLQIGAAFQPLYGSETGLDSPPISNYFNELVCNDY